MLTMNYMGLSTGVCARMYLSRKGEYRLMTETKREQLKQSIAYAKDKLSKGLLLPSDASQLVGMIVYYERKLKEAENNEQ